MNKPTNIRLIDVAEEILCSVVPTGRNPWEWAVDGRLLDTLRAAVEKARGEEE